MKVIIYSTNHFQKTGTEWFHGCEDISYFLNSFKKEGINKQYYTLTFTYSFEYLDDTVYFAYSYPYTYTRLMRFVSQIQQHPLKATLMSRDTLCETLGGVKCETITITSPSNKLVNYRNRKGVVISARVHPGESVGSWVMQGVLNFLTSNDKVAKLLRCYYIFKIIPMLNPDGVIAGNYRCSLLGVDLNRR